MYDAADLMKSRHSVRRFTGETIPPELRGQLSASAEELNEKGDLRIRILFDEPVCFSSRMAKYGMFENCRDYIAMIGRKAPDLEERCGYWGEKLVLKAQELGLNTCRAAMTHGKSCAAVEKGEAASEPDVKADMEKYRSCAVKNYPPPTEGTRGI